VSLKPFDILVVLGAHLWSDEAPWSYERLGAAVGVSASQAHGALRRLSDAGLYRERDRSLRVHAFTGFAAHGLPYVFPARPGAAAQGTPTAHAAPPLSEHLVGGTPYVWPTGQGVEGFAIKPLHPSVPDAAARDPKLYASLALVDALRGGRVRERQLAVSALECLLVDRQRDALWIRQRAREVG
jgi:hypothetical protein